MGNFPHLLRQPSVAIHPCASLLTAIDGSSRAWIFVSFLSFLDTNEIEGSCGEDQLSRSFACSGAQKLRKADSDLEKPTVSDEDKVMSRPVQVRSTCTATVKGPEKQSMKHQTQWIASLLLSDLLVLD